jgi:hypothetical protein
MTNCGSNKSCVSLLDHLWLYGLTYFWFWYICWPAWLPCLGLFSHKRSSCFSPFCSKSIFVQVLLLISGCITGLCSICLFICFYGRVSCSIHLLRASSRDSRNFLALDCAIVLTVICIACQSLQHCLWICLVIGNPMGGTLKWDILALTSWLVIGGKIVPGII